MELKDYRKVLMFLKTKALRLGQIYLLHKKNKHLSLLLTFSSLLTFLTHLEYQYLLLLGSRLEGLKVTLLQMKFLPFDN